MIYFLTASKDASVYLQQPNQNTGLDEILEISKLYYGQIKDVSRALIKFDVGFLSASISIQETIFPVSARQVPVTSPTYPVPITAIFIFFE